MVCAGLGFWLNESVVVSGGGPVGAVVDCGLWARLGGESEAEKEESYRAAVPGLGTVAIDWLAAQRAGLERLGRMGSDQWLLDGRDWNGTGDRLVGAVAGHCSLFERVEVCKVQSRSARGAQCQFC